jgi:hypothetical protein
MNFILNHKYSDGNTPVRPEEAEQLIPRINTKGELIRQQINHLLAGIVCKTTGFLLQGFTPPITRCT